MLPILVPQSSPPGVTSVDSRKWHARRSRDLLLPREARDDERAVRRLQGRIIISVRLADGAATERGRPISWTCLAINQSMRIRCPANRPPSFVLLVYYACPPTDTDTG
mmetsp:Transcript_41848/g.89160  ORF Transcript_41848/g.89160 Transcript_41848/m.89160 type:complete len:108 (-) Transcript_41848:35-358(-)